MNEYNKETNNGNVAPYKASGNLNTIIGNPSININDTMNINIQSMSTNSVPIQNLSNANLEDNPQVKNNNINASVSINNENATSLNSGMQSNVSNSLANNRQQSQIDTSKSNTTSVNNVQNTNQIVENIQKTSGVQKKYVTIDNKPKKKKLSLSLGPEFKIGLLIIVILLVFVLFLPMISELINGY